VHRDTSAKSIHLDKTVKASTSHRGRNLQRIFGKSKKNLCQLDYRENGTHMYVAELTANELLCYT
jgi:hypothetical protein